MSMSCFDCHDYMNGYNCGKKEGTIEELEKIKEEIKDLDLEFFDEDYRAGVARGIMEYNKILSKRIAELKDGGKNNG